MISVICCVFNIYFCIHQMSKSTGNFLTLTQAIDKFSADGIFWIYIIPYNLQLVQFDFYRRPVFFCLSIHTHCRWSKVIYDPSHLYATLLLP